MVCYTETWEQLSWELWERPDPRKITKWVIGRTICPSACRLSDETNNNAALRGDGGGVETSPSGETFPAAFILYHLQLQLLWSHHPATLHQRHRCSSLTNSHSCLALHLCLQPRTGPQGTKKKSSIWSLRGWHVRMNQLVDEESVYYKLWSGCSRRGEWMNESMNQSIDQSIDQSINHVMNGWKYLLKH